MITTDHPFIAEDSRTTNDSIVDLRSQDRQASCTPERSSPSERTQNSAHLLSNLGWLELANGARLWGLGGSRCPSRHRKWGPSFKIIRVTHPSSSTPLTSLRVTGLNSLS